ncbi:complex I intermediate-associated protein 30, mitochondrial-like isoform X1 [Limulus polyphemus]|uniref:Complex I intermediate-associated protein 30, mitochondrial-like isoform X1 n=2 Tax=Limulus polyphemus TaxID=6850 RepID=A0ABM1BHE4_LIMPO|nr:complex I intermediate-associated protein 30, mitochondrial-like isoform X1 [Limulus polyphemus]XP_013782043.1 complex I intermediate-associated protein 30, mitochondrial-like isoform X1 [Limulus polyphemus]XP_022250004.1 complex I intermediate-associated protein 30, mitochondrial-like isoform X1 [Limulus polyphemus]
MLLEKLLSQSFTSAFNLFNHQQLIKPLFWGCSKKFSAPLLVVPIRGSFWERDIKGPRYRKKTERNYLDDMKYGIKELKNEVQLWKEEMSEKFQYDPKVYMPDDSEIVWTFDTKEKLNQWVCTSDSDNKDGFSHCDLTLSKNKKGLFSGFLDCRVPKDGQIKESGYCNIRCLRARKSFKRDSFFDWQMFTHLILRIRGDGRSYMLNLTTTGYFDVMWHDIYNYILFTRGGPYWQVAKIPFSKFFLSSKGRIQDKQDPIPLDKITNIGITCAGKTPGPFQLEIDYIGVHFDGNHTEEFAYEMYNVPSFIVGV